MMKRILLALAAACAVTVLVAFFFGAFYAVVLSCADPSASIQNGSRIGASLLPIILYVASTFAIVSCVVALVVSTVVVGPIFMVISRFKTVSLKNYFFVGIVLSFVVSTVLLIFQFVFANTEVISLITFEIAAIFASGVTASLAFGRVVGRVD